MSTLSVYLIDQDFFDSIAIWYRHIVETGLEVIDEPCLLMSPVPVQTVD